MSLIVKAYSNDEIRRFAVDQNVTTSYNYLYQKIGSLFPNLLRDSYVLKWRDTEGDLITFSSDDELIDALSNMNDEIFRVYIKDRPQPRLSQAEHPPFYRAWWGCPRQQRPCGERPKGPHGCHRRWRERMEQDTQSNENPGASSHNQNSNNEFWAQQFNPEMIHSFVTNMLQSFGVDLSSCYRDTKDSKSDQENSGETQHCDRSKEEQQADSGNKDNACANATTLQDSVIDVNGDFKEAPQINKDQESSTNTNIQEAVAQMTAMGFDDQGGWLTRLLEAKNGSIGRSLEAIYPNRSKESGQQ